MISLMFGETSDKISHIRGIMVGKQGFLANRVSTLFFKV
jgi:hypothetical protein